MKKNMLFFFFFGLLIATCLLLFSRDFFLRFTSDYPFIGGFIKFFVLASIGDLLSSYLKHKNFVVPEYFFIRASIWGMIGLMIVFMFPLYTNGVAYLFKEGLLPFEHPITQALMTSIFMNITFGAMMMLAHFTTDGYLDHKKDQLSLKQVLYTLDYPSFMVRTFGYMIPLFWIPAHTITFLLPTEYRVLFAASLGIALGFILGMTKRVKKDEVK